MACHIDNLADKEQTGLVPCLHRLRRQFTDIDATKRNLGRTVPLGAARADLPSVEPLAKPRQHLVRQVGKPPGAKPGLVSLRGDVTTLRVDWRKERHRLERLEATAPGAGGNGG